LYIYVYLYLYHLGWTCYRPILRPPVSQMRKPILTKRLLKFLRGFGRPQESSAVFLSQFTWARNGRAKYFIHQSIVVLLLPRKCRLVSCSSSHREYNASLLFNRVRCRFTVLCPVSRPMSILISLHSSLKAYLKSCMFTPSISCLS